MYSDNYKKKKSRHWCIYVCIYITYRSVAQPVFAPDVYYIGTPRSLHRYTYYTYTRNIYYTCQIYIRNVYYNDLAR